MKSISNYSKWADALRKRYGGQLEAEKQAIAAFDSSVDHSHLPTVDPLDVERQRTVVAEVRDRLRKELLATLERAAGGIAARELATARKEFPDLLNESQSVAIQGGQVVRANEKGGTLFERRGRMAEIAAHALQQSSGVEESVLVELRKQRDSLGKNIEELRNSLRTQHKVQTNVLSGLETVVDDRAFHKLIDELTADGELEAQWRIDPDIGGTLAGRTTGGGA